MPIVAEIVTKPGSVDVSSEVAKLRRAKPDFVIFHGYVLAPIPEFIKQMRESGMASTPMGTIWSMDKTTVDAMGAAGQGWMGVMPYRYSYDTADAPMMKTMVDFAAKARPNMNYVPLFYTHGWLVGMIFAEVLERCVKANKPLTGANMSAALESINDWDTGGVTGLLVVAEGPPDPVRAHLRLRRRHQAAAAGQRMDQDGVTRLTQPPALSVENIEVVYHHTVQVLRGLSLELPRGAIVALLGANGAGKTTTLKAISGLLPLEVGEIRGGAIRFRGERIDGTAPHLLARRGIAHVREGRHVFEDLTVDENLVAAAHALTGRKLQPDFALIYDYFPHLKRGEACAPATCRAASSRCWRSAARCSASPR